jgi:proteic killer suppression protein
MIHNFRSKETRAIWEGYFAKGLPNEIQQVARRKLRMLNAARRLEDLKIPPANRLEALKGERKGQHSIRINNQWRVCFVWTGTGAKDVEIVDYH